MMPNFKPRLGTKFQAQTAPVNDGQFIVATVPPAGSLPTLLFVKHGKIRSLKLGDEGDILTVRNGEIVWEPPQYQ